MENEEAVTPSNQDTRHPALVALEHLKAITGRDDLVHPVRDLVNEVVDAQVKLAHDYELALNDLREASKAKIDELEAKIAEYEEEKKSQKEAPAPAKK